MSWGFRKTIKIGPFRINFSRGGVGHSVGKGGVRYTKRADGGKQVSVDLPGGFSWRRSLRRR
ncbi:DUF4236 domain-containing protein [Herbidospora galbida]|uniref:DUF4236 domain-containing protein n=2 Tax=Herbidospora TaxID=28443 RepID=A0A4U3MA80_9ACTN|nr:MULTISPECIES: DUF4236 domain-containing protein [Herbidospora]NAS23262.1 DUF4236 domain-containing protein [Herbidospora solisilvae]TKK85004.1 DUF4236 domain-containing protein [Herbidospora galbida]GLX92147.1 hypothetical protein Hesp01_00970 [Herbidospora sp. NBRC 101105]